MIKNKRKIEDAKKSAWSNYEYRIGCLYDTTFQDGFQLGAEWQKQYISDNIEKLMKHICKDNTHLLDTPEIQEIIEYFKQ